MGPTDALKRLLAVPPRCRRYAMMRARQTELMKQLTGKGLHHCNSCFALVLAVCATQLLHANLLLSGPIRVTDNWGVKQ